MWESLKSMVLVNWKTTFGGLLAGLLYIAGPLNDYWVHNAAISPREFLIGAGMVLVGLFSRDHNKTSEQSSATPPFLSGGYSRLIILFAVIHLGSGSIMAAELSTGSTDPFPVALAYALSLVATALLAAAGLVVAWMRRTFALLRPVPVARRLVAPQVAVRVLEVQRTILCPGAGAPRAPPALS